MAKRYQAFAAAIGARENCAKSGNAEWYGKWTERLEELEHEMPSGSGFDCGTKIDLERSTSEKLVFTTSYHHMDDGGSYDGWTEHEVIVTPSLQFGFQVRVTGRDRNDTKDYIAECFDSTLREDQESLVTA